MTKFQCVYSQVAFTKEYYLHLTHVCFNYLSRIVAYPNQHFRLLQKQADSFAVSFPRQYIFVTTLRNLKNQIMECSILNTSDLPYYSFNRKKNILEI